MNQDQLELDGPKPRRKKWPWLILLAVSPCLVLSTCGAFASRDIASVEATFDRYKGKPYEDLRAEILRTRVTDGFSEEQYHFGDHKPGWIHYQVFIMIRDPLWERHTKPALLVDVQVDKATGLVKGWDSRQYASPKTEAGSYFHEEHKGKQPKR